MSAQAIAIENTKTGELIEAVYEHPFVVRLCHWVNAVSLFVMAGVACRFFAPLRASGRRSRKRICSIGPRLLPLVAGWAVHYSGTSPLCESTSALACCTPVTRSSVATTSRCSSCDETCPECGRC
jgi:hypothetical protein